MRFLPGAGNDPRPGVGIARLGSRTAKPLRKPIGPTAAAFPRKRDPAIILRRNIFDSARGDLTAEPLPEVSEDGQPLEEWDPSKPAPNCTGKLRLVGSVVSPGFPEWSFAAIAGTDDGKTMLYREGSAVDGSRVLAVQSSSVVVSGSSGACQLLMFDEEENAVARAPAQPKKPSPQQAKQETRATRGSAPRSSTMASRRSPTPGSTSSAAWSTKPWRIREA